MTTIRHLFAALLLAFASATSCWADGLQIVAPESVPGEPAVVDIEAATSAVDVTWHIWPPEVRPLFRCYRHVAAPLDDQPTQPQFRATISRPPKGRLIVIASAVVDGKVVSDEQEITIGVGPAPDPDPQPEPQPEPPQPEPKSPIDWPGLAVLIVYESGDVGTMPRSQFSSIAGRELRDKLSMLSSRNEQRQPMWRIHDQHADVSNEQAAFRDAMARPRGSVPWIVIGNGKTGYEGPLPIDTPSIVALIEKYKVAN